MMNTETLNREAVICHPRKLLISREITLCSSIDPLLNPCFLHLLCAISLKDAIVLERSGVVWGCRTARSCFSAPFTASGEPGKSAAVLLVEMGSGWFLKKNSP